MPSPARPFLLRLILPFALLVVLIVVVCGATIFWAGVRAARSQQLASLNRRIEVLAANWRAVSIPGTLNDHERKQLSEEARLIDARVTLLDGVGNVVFDSHHDASTMINHNTRPEVAGARQLGTGTDVRQSETIGRPSVYVARPLDPAQPNGLVLRVSDTEHNWAGLSSAAGPLLLGGVAAALLTCLLLWMLLNRRWVAPMRRLADAADQMAAGDWARRVEPTGADELKALSARLNLVAAHAQKQLAELRHQQADLQALVDTLPDPILRADPQGHVTLMNTAASRLLEVTRSRGLGQLVLNVVADEAVLQLFEKARELPMPPGRAPALEATRPGVSARGNGDADGQTEAMEHVARELRLHRDGQVLSFQAVGARTADGGVLLVLRDMTAFSSAMQMKTDFVANASHELRTPIAAIKIAFETLNDVVADDPEQTTRCLTVIDGHLRRLEEMLRDLLDLSRVESANLKPHVRMLKTSDVFAHVKGALSAMARQKGVELRLGVAGGRLPDGREQPAHLLGDERLLNLVLKNLVENSIKFTPQGGSVTVSIGMGLPAKLPPAAGPSEQTITPDPAHPPVCVGVTDTGVGIPPEHMDRVFERFYQVDPARSGSAGRGTGLGLAIVKHAVAALGGMVHLESTYGKGTTVSFVIPQDRPQTDEQPVDDDAVNALSRS